MARLSALLIIPALLVAVSCGKSGKYADVKDFMNKMMKINESYISSLEKASTSKEVIKAINTFGDDLAAMSPEAAALEKKYPDLNNKEKVPEELKPEMEKMEQLGKRNMKVSQTKLMKHMRDPEVLKAFQSFAKKMQNMKFFAPKK